ncbi:MAG TPA: YlxR family protein [Nocardioidaceae bacterium]|nr:YlxR family protein [Nocardioidaceae bacterium]
MSRTTPVRTCVGCRKREAKSDLLRVVGDASAPEGPAVAVDTQARRSGRGAYLHLSLDCLDQAERRRALPRALRSSGTLDTSALRAWISARGRGPDEAPAAPSTTK